MIDPRLLGRRGLAETAEDLTRDKARWILCSRDYARRSATADVTFASTASRYAGIASAHPLSSCLDGNRQSWCETTPGADWIEFSIDVGLSRRKSLLFLEYPEGKTLKLSKLLATNDAGAFSDSSSVKWGTVYEEGVSGSITILHDGRSFRLIELPWNDPPDDFVPTIRALVSSVPAQQPWVEVAGSGLQNWRQGFVIPQSGSMAGQPRRIVDVNSPGPTTFYLDDWWPVAIESGTDMLLVQYGGLNSVSQYLGNRYFRMRIARTYNAGLDPIRIVSVSLFDYDMILKGDKGGFREISAPSPTGVTRSGNPVGTVHEGLNGDVRFEQSPLGPKRRMSVSWQNTYAGFFDWMEAYAGRGLVGVVDEQSRYMQGYFQNHESEGLRQATTGGAKVGFRAEFIER